MIRDMRRKPKPLTQQIRDAIDASDMSRYRIAKMTDLSQSMMSRFMGGTCGVNQTTLDKIGELLGLRIVIDSKRPRAKKAKVTR
jgi:predicted XRE-type DNA-binding protein